MATAICRHLHRRGIRVAPFKAQNMSNNSYPCVDGGEIGRAQVEQARACGLEPSVDMNPLLLKPNSDQGSQIVVQGRVWRTLPAREYYKHSDWLRARVMESYDRLARTYDFIVIEGAGSVTEMNLKARDLVNFNMARAAKANALLVADIDLGGVFASLVGTFELLDDDERRMTRSFAINRFRGDRALFDGGVEILESRTGKPCLGVFPMAPDVRLDSEDAVCLPPARNGDRIAIVRLPRISNFTDFKLLPSVAWIDRPVDARFDVVILPGTKNTVGDLRWMRERGLDEWVARQHREGARVLGICGGFQMLGETIDDPEEGSEPGLGLLPVRTVMQPEKTVQRVNARLGSGTQFDAYEIHMGETQVPSGSSPFAFLMNRPEGMRLNGCAGTYLHGALEHPAVVREVIGVEPLDVPSREVTYEQLADWFEQNANLERFEELYL
jgi:adenosylcobyric acid synthase